VTEIVDHIHLTWFFGRWQMGMKDRSLIEIINLSFIALTATVIHHCLLACKPGNFMVPLMFGPGGRAHRRCHTSNHDQVVNPACMDVFHHHNVKFCSSTQQVQARKIDTICSIIRWNIHSTGTDPVMAQPHNNQGSFDEDFLDYVSEEWI